MNDSPTANRPRQVTVGALVAGGASAAMLLSVGTLLARWQTVDLRQGVAGFLSKGAGRTLGLDVDQALSLARVGLMVLGAVSAAILVFAFFAARRDRASRIAMTVLAVPLVLCGLFVDVFLTGFIVAATVLLWTAPARDWFAGRAPRVAQVPPLPPPSTASSPPPYAHPYGTSLPTSSAARVAARPARLVGACVATWVACSMVAGFLVYALTELGSDAMQAQFKKALAQNPEAGRLGLTVDDLVTATIVVCVAMLAWCLVAAVLAVLVWRRQNWARVVLALSALGALVLALLCTLAFLGFLVVVVACGVSLAGLLHRETTAWFSA